MHINTSTSKLKDTLKTLDDVRVNILQPTVQDLINNGTFDINNFTLTNASFVTSNNWEITCDSGHILDQSICKPCPIGYFLNETSDKCDQCPAGQYKDIESESTCSICPSGFTTLGSGSKSRLDCVSKYLSVCIYICVV
ncbi:thyroglobulin-like [Ruditapes philippinarum]|uniref:thyroglobulin-like n=1 Tax=Ruditapes philippinarum TaxID=129788 RepID=UPI00295B07D8|nr:thyroglobulin-like [Ruditapes philippinarum]